MEVVVDGLAYGVERRGAGTPLLVLHGFTGSAAAMAGLTEPLAQAHDVIAVDLPGHGATDPGADLARYGGARVARDLAAILHELGVPRAAWFGYSMGGRVALHGAAFAPDAVASLIVLGASPGIAHDGARAERRAADERLAERIERDGVAAFVAQWEREPLFASLAALPPERRAAIRQGRLANRAAGLAASLRGFGAGTMTPLGDRLGGIRVPVLALAGERDAAYAAAAEALAAAIPGGRCALVPAAGHAAHLERPAEVARQITEFVRSTAEGDA